MTEKGRPREKTKANAAHVFSHMHAHTTHIHTCTHDTHVCTHARHMCTQCMQHATHAYIYTHAHTTHMHSYPHARRCTHTLLSLQPWCSPHPHHWGGFQILLWTSGTQVLEWGPGAGVLGEDWTLCSCRELLGDPERTSSSGRTPGCRGAQWSAGGDAKRPGGEKCRWPWKRRARLG